MGKKRTRSSKTSKGQRPNVTKSTLKSVGKDNDAVDVELNKLKAWRAGKNPWVTIPNGGEGTNKPFIKVKANDHWGNPKNINMGITNGK